MAAIPVAVGAANAQRLRRTLAVAIMPQLVQSSKTVLFYLHCTALQSRGLGPLIGSPTWPPRNSAGAPITRQRAYYQV